jgi:hypothetical protein
LITLSRFSPALEPRFSFHGADVVEILETVGREVGYRDSTIITIGGRQFCIMITKAIGVFFLVVCGDPTHRAHIGSGQLGAKGSYRYSVKVSISCEKILPRRQFVAK